MLNCIIPDWVVKIFDMLEQGMIDQITINNMMNWLYQEGVIICSDVI